MKKTGSKKSRDTVPLKGHGNEADFLGFLQLMSPLYYISNSSNFRFEFAEIFVSKKRLLDSPKSTRLP
jgi:hypothetical protein